MNCGGDACLDECNVCDGPGIDWENGECDCAGNHVDECGVCGGEGIPAGYADCDGTPLPTVPSRAPETGGNTQNGGDEGNTGGDERVNTDG